MIPSDNLAGRQWHLFGSPDGRPGEIGLGLPEIWDDYTGRGVTIGIWDDGIEYTHPDLEGSYDPRLHVTLEGRVHDPMARSADSDHGTAVAGLIAADAEDGGTVGVAFGARIAGVDFDSSVGTDAITFGALRDFDVVNHSWSPDEGYTFDRNDRDWIERYRDGLEDSVETGRDGLGTVTVFSAGNRREIDRHTNDSGLTSAAEAIAVAAVGRDGVVSSFSSPGASLLISAPSSGAGGIWTTDRTGSAGYNTGSNQTWNPSDDHTGGFGGTSTSAALTTGVVALMLEANPGLGWRDVQDILAYSARHVGGEIGGARAGAEAFDWAFNGAETWNGGGLHHSNDYGFGLIDPFAAIRLAERWTETQTSANRRVETDADWSGRAAIGDGGGAEAEISLTVRAPSEVETVAVDLDFDGGRIADYRIVLVSPEGTRSVLSTPGRNGEGNDVTDWFFASEAFRGEDPTGTWTLRVSDPTDNGRSGTLRGVELILSGGAATADDVFIFTDEFSDYAGAGFGHSGRIADRDGGTDTINAAALRNAVVLDLRDGEGRIDGVAVSLAGRFERVLGGDGRDRIEGGRAGEEFDGGRGADRLIGRSGSDTLKGGGGKDILKGGGGADRLFGGNSRDTLFDGRGQDRLKGGNGDDIFRLASDGATDRILDFEDGSDRIRLSGVDFDDLRFRDRPGDTVKVVLPDDILLVRGDGLDAGDFSAADFLLS